MGVQGIQGDADAVKVTVASSQKMDNTMAQIRKVQEAEARFNQKRVTNPKNTSKDPPATLLPINLAPINTKNFVSDGK